MGASLPNHLYTVAAQSGGVIKNIFSIKEIEEVLDTSGGYSFASMVNLFTKSNVSYPPPAGQLPPPPTAPAPEHQQVVKPHKP
jgi:hypothetical protein